MCKRIIIFIGITVYILNLFLSAKEFVFALPAYPELNAESAILADTIRGQVLAQKNKDKRIHASIANKIMTSIIAIENGKLDSRVTISKESVQAEGSSFSLVAGEKYTIEELLYAVLLASANDACNSIAEHIGGDNSKFVELMNNKASQLNMKNTYFINPTGIYNSYQHTTISDISLLVKYAIGNSIFNNIFSSRVKLWENQSSNQLMANKNSLFWSYDGVDGGIADLNDPQTHTTITTSTRNDQRLVSIVINSSPEEVFNDSVKMLDYGFQNFRKDILVAKDTPLKSVKVGDEEINLVSIQDIYYTYPKGEYFIKSLDFIANNIKPPITRNQVVGTARYILNDNSAIDVNLYSDKDIAVKKPLLENFWGKITENDDIFYLLVLLTIVELIIIAYNISTYIKKRWNK